MRDEGRGLEYGLVAAQVCHQLMRFIDLQGGGRVALRPAVSLGEGLTPDMVFLTEASMRRIADVEPVHAEPPDLVVEIIPANMAWTEVEPVALLYAERGVPLVWIVDPYAQCVHVYGAGRDNEIFTGPELLPGDAVLKGLSLTAAQLFD